MTSDWYDLTVTSQATTLQLVQMLTLCIHLRMVLRVLVGFILRMQLSLILTGTIW